MSAQFDHDIGPWGDLFPWDVMLLDAINMALLVYGGDREAERAWLNRLKPEGERVTPYVRMIRGLSDVSARLMKQLDLQASQEGTERLSGVDVLNRLRDDLLSR